MTLFKKKGLPLMDRSGNPSAGQVMGDLRYFLTASFKKFT